MTGLILLAAGASARLGRPKQQLTYNGKSLLQHAIDTATHSVCSPVVIVLGANAAMLEAGLEKGSYKVIYNKRWEEGMASSIRLGLEEMLLFEPAIGDVIVMLCDQPFVDHLLLEKLINEKRSTGKKIVACFYNDTVGVPALFDKEYFPELLSLTGQEGAKKLLKKYINEIALVPFALGSIDIDTADDYDALINTEKKTSGDT